MKKASHMAHPEHLNPQAAQMADASMVRTLTAQADAIWPQEAPLMDRYGLSGAIRILDLGCGTGEGTVRLAEHYPEAHLLGLDLIASHLVLARQRCAAYAGRVRFTVGDAFALAAATDSYDLAVCRHMLQSIPYPERVIAEMCRVTRPGGWLHLIVEDYAMIHAYPTANDLDLFWQHGPVTLGRNTGTDLQVGRRGPALLQAAGLEAITLDYIVVDTLRVPRPTIATILEAWDEGYTHFIAENTELTVDYIKACWADLLACVQQPEGYFVWLVPVLGGRVPPAVR